MFDLGMQELIVIFIVALLVFGPRKLPDLARSMGKGIGQLKKAMSDIKTEVDREVEGIDSLKNDIPSVKEELAALAEEKEKLREAHNAGTAPGKGPKKDEEPAGAKEEPTGQQDGGPELSSKTQKENPEEPEEIEPQESPKAEGQQ